MARGLGLLSGVQGVQSFFISRDNNNSDICVICTKNNIRIMTSHKKNVLDIASISPQKQASHGFREE
jgi:hypothetical protein